MDGVQGRVDLDAVYKDYPALTAAAGASGASGSETERAREWVMERGISDGEHGAEAATRQQVWTMLYRMNGGK